MSSGTENVPAVAALGVAAERIYENLEEKREYLYGLRDYFVEEVTKIPGVSVNGRTGRQIAPHIVSVSIKGVRAEVILHTLEEKDIYVSAGSACSSNKPASSKTLKAIHLDQNLLDSTVRFSFSTENTMEEIDYALEIMRSVIPMLKKYTRR